MTSRIDLLSGAAVMALSLCATTARANSESEFAARMVWSQSTGALRGHEGQPIVINAQAPKLLRFWNLTAVAITELYLAPTGTEKWSPNLCLSDPDHTVEADERIGMNGVASGTYDLRVVDAEHRACILHGVTVKAEGAYALSVSEAEMKACAAR